MILLAHALGESPTAVGTAPGADLVTYGESVLLTTAMSVGEVWAHTCDAGCESAANWSEPLVADHADLIYDEMPATLMASCSPPYNAFWYPGAPAAAAGPSGVVIVHNPNVLYKCTSNGNVRTSPSIARVISSY